MILYNYLDLWVILIAPANSVETRWYSSLKCDVSTLKPHISKRVSRSSIADVIWEFALESRSFREVKFHVSSTVYIYIWFVLLYTYIYIYIYIYISNSLITSYWYRETFLCINIQIILTVIYIQIWDLYPDW